MVALGEVEHEAGGDDGHDQGPACPLQPAVDVALGRRLVQRQDQVIERHAREGEGGHDDQPAGCRKPADIGQQGQGLVVGRDAQPQGEVFRVGTGAQAQAGPQHQGHGQAHQQQEQRQPPAGADQRTRVEVFGERHVVHVRHDDRRGEEHQQQGAPRAFLQGRVQGRERRLVLQQPDLQAVGPAKDTIQGIKADAAQGDELDHRLEGDGEDQPLVLLTGSDVP